MNLAYTITAYLICIFNFCLADCYKLTHPVYHPDCFANPGFFSVFNTVLGALDAYDQNNVTDDFIIDFEDKGWYYDTKYGPNWWNYYFEPIHKVSKNNTVNIKTITLPTYKKIIFSLYAQFDMPAERGHELITKYIHIKPFILKKVDDFIDCYFTNHRVIGIHYRGTDKKTEAPEVSYATVYHQIINEISIDSSIRLFIATDDAHFLSYMKKQLPAQVIAYNAFRSDSEQAVHTNSAISPFEKGQEALIDCLILSRCEILYKMASNLSDTCIKFNPSLCVIPLNAAYSTQNRAQEYGLETIYAVLYALEQYEQHNIHTFYPCFPLTTEENWWNIFFEPLFPGMKHTSMNMAGYTKMIQELTTIFEMSSEHMHELIKKYIRFKQHLVEKAKTILLPYQQYKKIGLFYKREPETWHHPSVSYETVVQQLKQVIDHKSQTVVIVISSDNTCIDTINDHFFPVLHSVNPNKLVTGIEKQEQDIINLLLLLQTDIIIGCSSTMLTLASLFNPHIPIILLDTNWLTCP